MLYPLSYGRISRRPFAALAKSRPRLPQALYQSTTPEARRRVPSAPGNGEPGLRQPPARHRESISGAPKRPGSFH